tara:strand:+ start:20995 stop:21330 length:336 start_codon:yes stop_codon:yes gene_type:complete
MSTHDMNSSINNLIGTFSQINSGDYAPIPTESVCIDTSNNRIGVNTLDPSYGIHVNGTGNKGKIGSTSLIVSSSTDEQNTEVIFKNLPTNSDGLESGRLYNDNGTLKIVQG